MADDGWSLGGQAWRSRLLLGTARHAKKIVLCVGFFTATSQCAKKVAAWLKPIINAAKKLLVFLPWNMENRVKGYDAVET